MFLRRIGSNMKRTTKQRRTDVLFNVLKRFERHEYRRWVAQDETEGTGKFYWTLKRDDRNGGETIEDEEFFDLLALAVGFQKAKKLHAAYASKQY
jgi:hypothetical protein